MPIGSIRGEITRDVPVRDVSPSGDWSQVQVWNVPGRHWGGRKYDVQGFILSPSGPSGEDAAEIATRQFALNNRANLTPAGRDPAGGG